MSQPLLQQQQSEPQKTRAVSQHQILQVCSSLVANLQTWQINLSAQTSEHGRTHTHTFRL